jgi:hypothetical protein
MILTLYFSGGFSPRNTHIMAPKGEFMDTNFGSPCYWIIFIYYKNVVTQSRTSLQIYEGRDDQLIDRDQWLNVTSESRDRI